MIENIRKYILIAVGSFIVSVGIYYFWTPSNLAPGGLTGMSTILNSVLPGLSVSQSILIINIVLIILGIIFLGVKFMGLTAYSSLLISFNTFLFDYFFMITEPFVESVMLNTIFGGVLVGIGVGIVYIEGSSTGGSDIIGKIIEKYSSLSISDSVFLTDSVITLLATTQIGIENGMYSLIGIAMSAMFLSRTTEGFQRKIEMKIISLKNDEINRFINTDIDRGTTIFNISGGFSRSERSMIHTVLHRRDYIRVKNFISEIDPHAFVIINSVNEVVGEGFTYETALKEIAIQEEMMEESN